MERNGYEIRSTEGHSKNSLVLPSIDYARFVYFVADVEV
jgi:hypothetical protein